jgi:glycosyltransferase involved in cell wall biosynthesis
MTTAQRFKNGKLQKAIDSVMAQDFKDFEFVIYDDASTDGTQQYLQSISSHDKRIKIIRNSTNVNSVAISLGRCLAAADKNRKYVTWMFDDNEMRLGCLSKLLNMIEAAPDLDFVFGKTHVHSSNCKLIVGDKSPEYIRENINNFSILVPNAGILFKQNVFAKYGWYDASVLLRRACDWDFFCRIINGKSNFAILDEEVIDEYGETESDSLRKTFTTDFALMQKYVIFRDQVKWPLTLEAALYHPTDKIPPGNWQPQELKLIYFIFLEYYISIGNFSKAYEWAEKLHTFLPDTPFYFDKLKALKNLNNISESAAALASYSALIFGHYKIEQIQIRNHYLESREPVKNNSILEIIKGQIRQYKIPYLLARNLMKCIRMINKTIRI